MSGWALLNKERTQILQEFSVPKKFYYEDIFNETVQELQNPGTDEQKLVQVEKTIDNSRWYVPEFFRESLEIRKLVGLFDIVDEEYPDQQEFVTTHHELVITDVQGGVVTRNWISVPKTNEQKIDSLQRIAEDKCNEIDHYRDHLGNQGFEFGGKIFELRGTSDPLNFVSQALFAFLTLNTEFKDMIAQVNPEIAAQIVWDGNEKWTDKNNEDFVIPTAMTMIIMALTAATSKKRVIRNAIAHKKIVRDMALDPETTVSEIKEYDFSGGW